MSIYEESGVSIKNAEKLNKNIAKSLDTTAFAGGINLGMGLKLISCCDGIGSKIIELYSRKMYKTIAIDLVAANLNDIICTGATAIGLVNYIAVNKLDPTAVAEIINEIQLELTKYSVKLLGGETSELRDLITKPNIDICATAIGTVKKEFELCKNNVQHGDLIIGLASSGVHANGFSLIRNKFDVEKYLAPTLNYYNEVHKLVQAKKIKTCANITGGGIFLNLIRTIPKGFALELHQDRLPYNPIFNELKTIGDEFYQIFNAGVGFCIICDKKNKSEIFEVCAKYSPFEFGRVL